MGFRNRRLLGILLVGLLNTGMLVDGFKQAHLKQIVGSPNVLFCPQGYILYTNGYCYDIDECQASVFPCEANQFCINTAGSYTCTESTSALLPTFDVHQHPKVLNCPDGYVLFTNGMCYDIDECRGPNFPCEDDEFCINTGGSYYCTGTTDEPDEENEHMHGSGTNENQETPDVGLKPSLGPGSIQPTQEESCTVGYIFEKSSNRCIDIDECATGKHQCGPEQNCQNYEGGYSCFCKPAFPLNPTTNRCEASHRCPAGFVNNNTTQRCDDINECTYDNSCTGPGDICQNIRGSYICHKIECPPEYTKEEPTEDSPPVTCTRNEVCQSGDAMCINKPYTILYNILTLPHAIPIPEPGHIKLLSIHDMQTFPDWTAQFSLNFIRANAFKGAASATSDTFSLRSYITRTDLLLTKSIAGPQDIELEIVLKSYNAKGIFAAVGIAKILLIVSEYGEIVHVLN